MKQVRDELRFYFGKLALLVQFNNSLRYAHPFACAGSAEKESDAPSDAEFTVRLDFCSVSAAIAAKVNGGICMGPWALAKCRCSGNWPWILMPLPFVFV